MATTIAVPSTSGIQKNLQGYGVGLLAGVGYNLISGITGSGLIGGALAAALAGATVRGPVGEVLAVQLGFQSGRGGGIGGNGLSGLTGLLGGKPKNGPAKNGNGPAKLITI